MSEYLLSNITANLTDLTDKELVTLKERIVVLQVNREDDRVIDLLETKGKI
jgi:hypothetical protein